MKNLLFTIAVALMLVSCASADKLLETGDYDSLIQFATKKLSGNKKKDKYVKALETGFDKLIRRDMARIEALKATNTPESWEDIMDVVRRIEQKQSRIEPFLPLISESGYQAKFTFVRTQQIEMEARSNAVLLYQKRLDALVSSARDGSKQAAREAHVLIDRIRHLNPDIIKTELRDEMWDRGINKILVRIDNEARTDLPPHYEEELLSVDLRNTGGNWDRFFTHADPDLKPDFEVVLRILDIAVSPDLVSEKQHAYTKDVKDGWEYVLDQNGNVAKDSLGNDIKRDKFIRVNATIVETLQAKDAFVKGRVDIIDRSNGARVYSQPVEVDNHFAHTARNLFGDERAVEDNLRKRITPLPYPSELTMIMDAFKAMKPKFFNEIKRYNYQR